MVKRVFTKEAKYGWKRTEEMSVLFCLFFKVS